MHGASIAPRQLSAFGGVTFGIRSLSKLAAEVLYQSSKVLDCGGYRFGPVRYQYASLSLFGLPIGSAAIALGGSRPAYINPLDTDVLRKEPILPFIHQDEWRIAIFPRGYLQDDPNAPLEIFVDPSHFYCYE